MLNRHDVKNLKSTLSQVPQEIMNDSVIQLLEEFRKPERLDTPMIVQPGVTITPRRAAQMFGATWWDDPVIHEHVVAAYIGRFVAVTTVELIGCTPVECMTPSQIADVLSCLDKKELKMRKALGKRFSR